MSESATLVHDSQSAAGTEPLIARNLSFDQLLADGPPLQLDAYQRGFVWSTQQIRQLVKDLKEYAKSARDAEVAPPPYYMGTLLIHHDRNSGKRFVIDGQQRLTTLCLLHHKVYGQLPVGQALEYSPQSARKIREAVALLLQDRADLPSAEIFDRLQFTVITVAQQDLAFTFFDSQNNRGVQLEATDLLKSFHLRDIASSAAATKAQVDSLQRRSALSWEESQRTRMILAARDDSLPVLFDQFLWRGRRWRGNHTPRSERATLLKEFQERTWPAVGGDAATVPVYAGRNNRLAADLRLTGESHVLLNSALVMSHDPADLPFALRQPIQNGAGFFLYVSKYAALLAHLSAEDSSDDGVRQLASLYSGLLSANQYYLREAFWLAILLYADQFGTEEIFRFALYLEYVLGAVRLSKAQVRRETAELLFRDSDHNLLDVIAHSYHPREVHEFIAEQANAWAHVYDKDELTPVQTRYAEAVRSYFMRSKGEHLTNKLDWLKELLPDVNW